MLASVGIFQSQPAVTFVDENFSTSNGFRKQTTKENNFLKIEGGKLLVENNAADNMFWPDLPYHFYTDSSVYFEMDFKLIRATGNYGYGILFHVGNYDYEYWITPNGYYMVRAFDSNSKKIEMMEYITADEIKQGTGAVNRLGVECKRGIISVYINGEKKGSFCNGEVYKAGTTKVYTKSTPYYSQRTSVYSIGLALPNNFTVEVSRFASSKKPHTRTLHLISNPSQGYKKENLGAKVNSRCEELNPMVSADDNNIYYSIRECDLAGTNAREDDDLFHAQRDSSGHWKHFIKVSSTINNKYNQGMIGISGDNSTLYYKGYYDGYKQTVWMAQRSSEGKWSKPAPVNVPRYTELNRYTGKSISSNRKIMLCYLEEANSIGNTDLYVAFSEDGINFSKPKNLGAVVNTPLSEFGAFLAPDNKTLYFASYGHGVYGSADIFVTRRLDDTWKKWSKPENLGPEINSADFDAYFSISASGKYAYLVSADNGTAGKSEIVRIQLPQSAKPDPVVLIKGRVLDAKTKLPLKSEVISTILKTNTRALVAVTDSADGKYQIILPAGELYDFLASKKGYYANSQHIDLTATTDYTEIVKDIFLQPVEVNNDTDQVVHLNNIFFVDCSDTIKKESYVELQRLSKFLKKNKDLDADIDQFMQKGGECPNTEELADKRAQAIKKYLVKDGIAETRLKHKSHVKTIEEKLAENPDKKDYIVPKNNEQHGHVEVRFIKTKAKKVYHVRKTL